MTSILAMSLGAGGRTRTGTLLPAVDFESTTSTYSITPAYDGAYYILLQSFFQALFAHNMPRKKILFPLHYGFSCFFSKSVNMIKRTGALTQIHAVLQCAGKKVLGIFNTFRRGKPCCQIAGYGRGQSTACAMGIWIGNPLAHKPCGLALIIKQVICRIYLMSALYKHRSGNGF